MATDIPASILAATTPDPEPKPGLALSWRFADGQMFSLLVGESNVECLPDYWLIRTEDGRDVTIYREHVTVFESREVTIRPRKVISNG